MIMILVDNDDSDCESVTDSYSDRDSGSDSDRESGSDGARWPAAMERVASCDGAGGQLQWSGWPAAMERCGSG